MNQEIKIVVDMCLYPNLIDKYENLIEDIYNILKKCYNYVPNRIYDSIKFINYDRMEFILNWDDVYEKENSEIGNLEFNFLFTYSNLLQSFKTFFSSSPIRIIIYNWQGIFYNISFHYISQEKEKLHFIAG